MQYEPDGTEESPEVGGREIASRLERVDPAAIEGFVDVNVAEASDQVLVEEGILDRAGAAHEGDMQGFRREPGRKWLRTKPAVERVPVVAGGERQAAEFPLVAEAQVMAPREVNRRVFEANPFRGGGCQDQAASHSQVHDEIEILIEDEGEVFAAAIGAQDGAADERGGGIGGWERGFEDGREVVQRYPHDVLKDDMWIDDAADGFDFGKFRHFGSRV